MNRFKKKILDSILTEALAQGNRDKYLVFKSIIEVCEKEYYEDNHITCISSIVSWLLMSDPVFWEEIKNETDESKKALAIARMKKVMESAVDDAVAGF